MKDIILFSALAGAALLVLLGVIFAIRNGRVGVDGSTAPYSLQSCRGKFVAIVFFYFAVGCALLAGAISTGLRIWSRL